MKLNSINIITFRNTHFLLCTTNNTMDPMAMATAATMKKIDKPLVILFIRKTAFMSFKFLSNSCKLF
jgi:hypothetical protein